MSSRSCLSSSWIRAPDLVEGEPGVVLVQEVRRHRQLGGGERLVGEEDAVLHVALGRHDDQQHPLLGERQELDVPERRAAAARRHHDAGETRELGEELRRLADRALRVVRVEVAFELPELGLVERPDREQRVDEDAVAARGGHAAGRGVRARDEAHFLQVGHHVAHGRRAQVEPGELRQRTRADRLAVGDVALDERFQQDLRALVHDERHSSNTVATSAGGRAASARVMM